MSKEKMIYLGAGILIGVVFYGQISSLPVVNKFRG